VCAFSFFFSFISSLAASFDFFRARTAAKEGIWIGWQTKKKRENSSFFAVFIDYLFGNSHFV
jgi:hypothetical protein